jgi:hypothetical protein
MTQRPAFTAIPDPSKALKIAGTHALDVNPFFEKRPYQGVVEFGDGKAITWPFRAQNVDATMFWGTADASAVEEELAGTGMWPVMVNENGVVRPLMQAWYLHYHDTSLSTEDDPQREYREFLTFLVVTDQPTVPLPYVNGFSTTLGLPPTIPGAKAFDLSLILDSELATQAGREISGLDKECVPTIDEDAKAGLRVSIKDSRGELLVNISANVDPRKMNAEIGDILKAYGFTNPSQLATLPNLLELENVTKDVRGGKRLVHFKMATMTTRQTVFHSVGTDDRIQVVGNCNLGRQLSRLDFKPEIVGSVMGMMGSYDLAFFAEGDQAST